MKIKIYENYYNLELRKNNKEIIVRGKISFNFYIFYDL